MCGIAGVVRIYTPGATPPPHHDSIPESRLDALDDSIRHRGPDGAGRFRDRATRPDGSIVDVALVHRRLSIIDHEGGLQPMVHLRRNDGTGKLVLPEDSATVEGSTIADPDLVAVAFNGCIYNHRELREELESLGHKFETDHSDTEVLIHGWREWKQNLCYRIRNSSMFAFLLWDRANANLIVATDFFGQKPLYMGGNPPLENVPDQDNVYYFSSTPSALPHLGFSEINEENIKGWTIWGHAGGAFPTADGVMLPPSTFDSITQDLEWDTKYGKVHEKFELKQIQSSTRRTSKRDFMLDSRRLNRRRLVPIDRLLSECVARRLESDTPVACLLSGGVDSSLVSYYAQQHLGNATTVAVRMPDDRFDESHHAATAAAAIGSTHITVDCSPNAADDLVHLITQLGLPFGDSSLLPTYWACKAAADIAPVLLTGDGGDELFVGYDRYFVHRLVSFGLGLTPLSMMTPTGIIPGRDPNSRATRIRRLIPAMRRLSYDSLLTIFQRPDAMKLFGGKVPAPSMLTMGDTPVKHADFDIEFMLPSDYLRKVDTASMAAGVETRAPFLDRELLLMTREYSEFLTAGGRKGFLRAIAKQYLPDSIVDRPKQGFAIPAGEWFRNDFGSMRQLLYDHLGSDDPFPGLAEAGVEIKMEFVIKMLREHDEAGEDGPKGWTRPWHGRDHSQRLYMLLVLSIWAKWLDRVKRESPATAG